MRDVEDVVVAVREAGGAGLTVRAVGSGHSFTDCAVTDGIMLDLSRWTGVDAVERLPGHVTWHASVRAGTPLRQLNADLDRLDLALTNLGDVDVQTIAGALATGTHGTGARYGGLATQVEALEMVLADGSVVTCSATERPELFAAARVGLGAFGVVTRVVLRVERAFDLSAVEEPRPLEDVLEGFDDFVDGADHAELYWWPRTDRTLTKRNTRVPAGGGGRPLPRWRAWTEDELLANGVYGGLCRATRAVPRLAPRVTTLSAHALGARRFTDRSHRVFCSPRHVRFVEMEYAVPREATVELVRGVRDLLDRHDWPVVFPIEVRVTAGDDAWLSAAHGRPTGYVAVHQYRGMPYAAYFDAVERLATDLGGRPHWGKLHGLDAAALATRYPRFADVRRVRDEVDPERRFGGPYLARVLG